MSEAGRKKSRIFLVEDEFLLAHGLECDLTESGFSVLGPFYRLGDARAAAAAASFDLALLDVNLDGEMVFPLARDLRERGIKFVFLTGYNPSHLPEDLRQAPRLAKPYDPKVLIRTLNALLA